MSFGGSGGGGGNLSTLSDTEIGSPITNNVLVYNANNTDNKWENTPLQGTVTLPTGGGVETLHTIGSRSSATTISLASGNVTTITIAANLTLTFSGATASTACSFGLYVTYNGNFTVTWPGSVLWPGGTEPTQSSTTSQTDVYVFETLNNGTSWYGSQVGANFS